MSSSEDRGPVIPSIAIATARTPGLDVARAIAVLGMVLVNYRAAAEASQVGPAWLNWCVDRLEGRAAALFVVLAGVGISLRARRALSRPEQYLGFERRALLKRALLLYVLGLLHLHLWEWDILHFYGLFLAIAAFLLAVPSFVLWGTALISVAVSVLLHTFLEYGDPPDLWTPNGMLMDLLFGGLHPLFPWFGFLVVGMWLGRCDLKDKGLRRKILWISLAATAVAETLDSLTLRVPELLGIQTEEGAWWWAATPRPPLPLYVVAGLGTAMATICVCIWAAERYARSRFTVALTATGQLAFTLYVTHALAIVIPQSHDVFLHSNVVMTTLYSLLFYALGAAGSLWWRDRFPHGPLEGLIRQITGRQAAGPWGGVRLSDLPPAPRKSSELDHSEGNQRAGGRRSLP